MKKFDYQGTGGELFVKLLVGGLLTMITLGIYLPWFMVSLTQYIASKTTLETQQGTVRFEFTGSGGKLFVLLLVNGLLTMITLGIYGAWFMVKLLGYYYDNSSARLADGTSYSARFEATGGELFVTILVGFLLSMITLGIYMPWFICKLQKLICNKTIILRGNAQAGSFAFLGTGGDLFVTFLVGSLLTMITLGIYGAWFHVQLMQFYASNSQATIDGQTYVGGFTGTGGELLVILLVGTLLTIVTLGIYGAWFMTNRMKFYFSNMGWKESAASA